MSDLPVLYESDGRLARITLNRPEVLNAIDDALPATLECAVKRANSDQQVRAIILAGAGRSFCTGYDLNYYAQSSGTNPGIQEMPWDPMKDIFFHAEYNEPNNERMAITPAGDMQSSRLRCCRGK